ncbi:MAG: type I-U CRISPR-associated protein Csx17 [Bryobacterales bacterium]|nr:type I-U CRISPR-associated protein Csx17 [Bryobacterales bacterium]
MSTSPRKLPAIPLPGLRPDSLGNYLTSVGLLRVLARRWPEVRIAWKDEVLHVVAGPESLDVILDELVTVASNKQWTPYERGWAAKQKECTQAKSGMPLAEWQSTISEAALELFVAHVVPTTREVHFNLLLGRGGIADTLGKSRRVFANGWGKAVTELTTLSAADTGKKTKKKANGSRDVRSDLQSWLMGRPLEWMVEGLNAASWFSHANKIYNTGQTAFREEPLSPWAMVLACEGLPFFAGSASKRLGSRARAVGAFPFVTQAAAPDTSGEAGRDNAEVWAPVWGRPMTLPEVRALFSRGRAEVHGRGAVTPAAFATAIMGRGIDAGIAGFLRFSLGRTTSANTFEPRFEGRIDLPTSGADQATAPSTHLAGALERTLELADRLPRDEKRGKRWRFVGLRGPIERAMIQLAASPSDPAVACSLLDAIVVALDKVDRNQGYRARQVSWKPLPIAWLPALFGGQAPPLEARLALAAVSGFPASRPFALYRFGVDWQYGGFVHPKQAPFHWVWGPGELRRVLANVLTRRVLDWERASTNASQHESPARLILPAACEYVDGWLAGQADEQLLECWLSRLALFDWRSVPTHVSSKLVSHASSNIPISGTLALAGLFQPLFDVQPVYPPGSRDNLLDPESGARTPAAARKLIALIRTGQVDAAVAFARSRYAMATTWLVKTEAPWFIEDPERLLASLLFTIPLHERGSLMQRWLRPHKVKGEIAYA